jgi:YVTN family beta-propeller protein
MSTLHRWTASSGPLALAILALLPLLGGHAQGAMADSAAVKRSSSAIALTSGGAMLLVVNPDSNSLTLVNTADHSVITEIPVGVDPRTVAVDDAGTRAYVANRGGDSVSVIDLS